MWGDAYDEDGEKRWETAIRGLHAMQHGGAHADEFEHAGRTGEGEGRMDGSGEGEDEDRTEDRD